MTATVVWAADLRKDFHDISCLLLSALLMHYLVAYYLCGGIRVAFLYERLFMSLHALKIRKV